mmetsp:Transcript_17152/g.21022  ORF Transcript_17152/g.21022 Transcript_17152/m.21022 type:complete len:89 (+) Transcript_17152:1515-1781(+)
MTARGECLLCCQGELHLEQTLHDLKTVYLPASSASASADDGSDSNADADEMELRISDPIVPFGETTTHLEAELHADFTAVSINQIPQR